MAEPRCLKRRAQSRKCKGLISDVRFNVAQEATLMTDEAMAYQVIGRFFARHETVNHSALQYGRGEFHTKTIEGYFRYTNRQANGFNDAMRSDELL